MRLLAAALPLSLAVACSPRPADDGAAPLGAIVSVSPAESAPGRTESIRIATDFPLAGGSVHVSAGEGITVGAVTVDGDALVVEAAISRDAVLGPRDVVVSQDGREARRHSAFVVSPPFTSEPAEIPSGAIATLRLRGLRTAWNEETSIVLDPRLRLLDARADGADDLEIDVRADLFGEPGPLVIELDGESATPLRLAATPVATLASRADVVGTLSGPGALAVWHAQIAADEAFLFRAADAVYEVYEEGNGFTPATWLWGAGSPIRRALAGRPVWIVLRAAAQEELDYTFSYRRASATALAPGTSAGHELAEADGVSAFRVAPAPWSVVEFRVDPSALLAPAAFAAHGGSWDSARDEAAAGASVYTRALASPHAPTVSLIVADASSAGGSFDVVASVAPLPGALATRDDVGLAIGDAVADTLTVPAAPAVTGSVHVAIDIAHEYRGDLRVSITSPSGTTVVLVAPDWTDFDRDRITAFPDVERPWEDLGAFAGEDASGEWTLTVEDVAPGGDGVLRGWALSIEPAG